MSALPALVGIVAMLLGGLGLREFLSGQDETAKDGRERAGSGRPEVEMPGLTDRIRRAGMEHVMAPRLVLTLKAVGMIVGGLFGSMFSGVLPGRIAPLVLLGLTAFGFIVPDLMLERAAKKRRRRMVLALPDVLDLLAVSVQTGRGLGGCLLDLADAGQGPLIREMSRAGDDMAWGSGQAAALEGLRQRVGGSEITSFVSTLERSRKLGSPLAEQLRRQSSTLRQDQRRAIEEEAARAAPKIQLVIALILVPSVLLLIVAALVANADSLLNLGY